MTNQPSQSKAQAKTSEDYQGDHQLSFFDCFKLASIMDWFLAILGMLLSFISGVTRAVFCLIISLAISAFDVRDTRTNFEDKFLPYALNFAYLAVVVFTSVIGSRMLLKINAQHQGYKFRRAYLKALLQHDITFYEKINPMEFSSQVESDCRTITEALDLQLEAVCSTIGLLISAIALSFYRSWPIALMMLCTAPLVFASMAVFHKTIMKASSERSEAYAKAGAIAEEALTNIKTVVSLGGEKTELKRYTKAVETTCKSLSRTVICQGLAFGAIDLIFAFALVIITYIGSTFFENGTINPSTGEIYTVTDINTPLYAIFQAVSMVPVLAGSLMGINSAKLKARKMLNVIQKVKTSESAQTKISHFKGAIKFNNVSFAYPTHLDKPIFTNLTLELEPNKKIAIVGESGCGKSTIVQLLQKFYEPQNGSIELDGHDLKTLDISWLRRNIAYVGQEPVLFSLTIRENLLLGKEDATENELIQALKKANAYDFVMDLDKKLDSLIGGGASVQLSGGQKQRIAIARALLKDAKVLIMDEATSALDRISEKEIQETVKDLGERTVIIIAHRLSTIKEADQIIVLKQGQVEEIGRHEEFMKKGGTYCKLQAAQAEMSSDNEHKVAENQNQDLDWEECEDETEEKSVLLTGSKKSDGEQKGLKNKSLTFDDVKRLWKLTGNKKKHFILGFFGSFTYAIVHPLNGLLIAVMTGVLVTSTDPDFRENMNLLCILLMAVGFVAFVIFVIEFAAYSKASESMIQILRREVFYKFLRMHMGWHDQPQNKPANLVACLEKDTSNAGQITGTSLGIIIQIILSCFFAVVAALFIAWKVALAQVFIIPFVLFVAFKVNSNEAALEERGASLLSRTDVLVSEAINNMKTLISLDAQDRFLKEYSSVIDQYHQLKLRTGFVNCMLQGLLFLILYLAFAAMYYLGAYLFINEGLEIFRIMFVIFGVTFTALDATRLFYLLPDTGRAVHSVHQIFNHLDMQSKIDIEDKSKTYRGQIEGKIEFKDVSFHYPTRKPTVLHNLSFKIDAGRQIGLTGPSGCGKSTIVQLLLRLYDVDSGEILIEGVNIKDYDLTYLRRKIAVVSQEPVLFYGSIEYNLKYANEEVSEEEMKEAALKANATRFIETNLENTKDQDSQLSNEGYARKVGPKGSQLSGGQKQRIALARAILRKPNILLLDEATSALDTESEILVQSALKTVSKGFSTICIAHRFSTIQDADDILVMNDGTIVEQGAFKQLIEKEGFFCHLKEGFPCIK